MNKNTKIGLAVLLLLILGALIYLTIRRNNSTANNEATVYNVESNIPDNAIVNSANTQPQANQNTSTQLSSNSFTDPLKLFTITLPSGWKAEGIKNSSDRPADEVVAITNAEKTGAYPTTDGESASIAYILVNTTNLSPKEYYRTEDASKGAIEKEYTINGHPAFYIKFVYPDYTDHYYLVSNKGKMLYFTFREIQKNTSTSPVTSENNTKYLSGYESLVNSVKFLN